MSKVVGLIPSRLESSRLPGKPLKDICGIPMIVHVYERTRLSKSLDEVYVVTDSKEICQVIENAGGKVLLTGSHHLTGSDRIAEAASRLDCDYVVNIQGDEALVNPHYINKVVEALLANPQYPIGILVNPYTKQGSPSDVKAVLNEKNEVMFMSRADIPSGARTANPPMLKCYHIVPFKREFLLEYASWSQTPLEKIEFVEYMRVLERGHKMLAVHVESDAVSVDTESDLEYVRRQMPQDPFFPVYRSLRKH